MTVMNRWPSARRGLRVVDGAQAELGLECAEDGLHVGEGGVGAPQGVFVPVGLAAAQAVDARMGEHRAVLGAAVPGDGNGPLAGLVGGDPDLIVRGDAGMLGFQAPDALPDLLEALVGRGDAPAPRGASSERPRSEVAKRSTMPRSFSARSSE